MGTPANASIKPDQRKAMTASRGMQNDQNGQLTMEAQDEGPDPGYVIYLYNILELPHLVQQPPTFPGLNIPPCPKGQKYAVTMLPPFTKLPFNRPGTTEMYYKKEDGRKAATSLLNPSAFPGTNWKSQLADWPNAGMEGVNLNKLGCFWSLTRPDEVEQLDEEIKQFREVATKEMVRLKDEAMRLAMNPKTVGDISPMHHFAMDYLNLSAPWHMTSHHMVPCPNCGETVREGIFYHKNVFGDKCIIDMARYKASIAPVEKPRDEDETEEEVAVPVAKTRRKSQG